MLLFSLVLAPSLGAQALFKVALRVTEKTGGQFESEYAAALRRLNDVQVVTVDETPDFVYSIVVQCIPDDCRNANNYAVAISLDRLLTPIEVEAMLQTALPYSRVLSPPERAMNLTATDSAVVVLLGLLRRYQKPVAFEAANWGRNMFRSAISEDVAEFDRKCLEKLRIEHRMYQSYAARDTVTGAALERRAYDPNAGWTC